MESVTWKATLREQLERHEGNKKYPYIDTVGKTSIGIGRNLTDKGLRPTEIDLMYQNDVHDAEDDARALLGDSVFELLTDNRKAVIVNMAFNLGITRLRKFVIMLKAIKEGRNLDVASAMLSSKWAEQVGVRATELARLWREG